MPPKHHPGCKAVRDVVAMMIIRPSRIMKVTCWLASVPSKPWLNSATRKADRTRIVIVAMTNAKEKKSVIAVQNVLKTDENDGEKSKSATRPTP